MRGEELTFRPRTNGTAHQEQALHRDVAERNRVWTENKLKKIESLKAQREEKEKLEDQECTFKP